MYEILENPGLENMKDMIKETGWENDPCSSFLNVLRGTNLSLLKMEKRI